MMRENEKFYNLRKTSELLGIKVRTLRDWIVKGKIVAIKYPNGRKWFVSENEIERLKKG